MDADITEATRPINYRAIGSKIWLKIAVEPLPEMGSISAMAALLPRSYSAWATGARKEEKISSAPDVIQHRVIPIIRPISGGQNRHGQNGAPPLAADKTRRTPALVNSPEGQNESNRAGAT